jgi:PHD/YefM family antitoxin component YafN of YafNO toxin-antitoxin module
MCVWEPPMETSHMLGIPVTRSRLRKLVSKQHSDKQDLYVTSNQKQWASHEKLKKKVESYS